MRPRIRALGRLLVFALLVALFVAKRRWLAAAFHGTDDTTVYLLDHLIELVAILVFCGVAARLEGRPFAVYGLPWREALRVRFWQGASVGFASLTALVLALHATGAIHVRLSATPALRAAGFGLAYAAVFVLLAVREEFLYRGYGQLALTEAAGFWPAAVVTSVWFMATHAGPRENALGLANVAIYGLVACLTLRRTGSLWLATGFHTFWDWGESYFFGVADSGHAAAPGHLLVATVSPAAPAWRSGGVVGPEGSVLCTMLLGLLAIVVARLLGPRPIGDTAATSAPGALSPSRRPHAGG